LKVFWLHLVSLSEAKGPASFKGAKELASTEQNLIEKGLK